MNESFGSQSHNPSVVKLIVYTYKKHWRIMFGMSLDSDVVEKYWELGQVNSVRYFVEKLKHPRLDECGS